MKSLASCLQKAGKTITQAEGKTLTRAQEEYIQAGLDPRQAANKAVLDFAQNLQDSYKDFEMDIVKQNGKPPFAEELVNIGVMESVVTEGDAKFKAEQDKIKAEAKAKKEAEEKAEAEKKAAEEKAQKELDKKDQEAEETGDKMRQSRLAQAVNWSINGMRRFLITKGYADASKYTDKQILEAFGLVDSTNQVTYTHKPDPRAVEQQNILPEAEEYFNDPSLTAKQAFAKTLELLDESDPMRIVGERILEHIPDTTSVHVIQNGDTVPQFVANSLSGAVGGAIRGQYAEGDGPVVIFRGLSHGNLTGINAETIVHEFIHVATSDIINLARAAKESGPKEFKKLPKNVQDAYNNLVAIHDLVMQDPDFVDEMTSGFEESQMYANMHNIAEFVTYALTKPAVIERLQRMYLPSEDRSAWSKFVHATAKLLGFKTKNDVTMYEAALHATDVVLQADFRRNEKLSEKLFGKSVGRWYSDEDAKEPLPPEQDEVVAEPEVAPAKTKVSTKKPKVKKLNKERVPVRVAKFGESTDVGTKAFGMVMKADNFVGDTTIQGDTADQVSVRSGSTPLGPQLLKVFEQDKAAAAALYYAIVEGVRYKVESKNPELGRRVALQIFNEVYKVEGARDQGVVNNKFATVINQFDFANANIIVGRSAQNIDFYRDANLLQMLDFKNMDDKEFFAHSRNPGLFIDPVILAKLKVNGPALWQEYAEYVYAESINDDGTPNRDVQNFYEFVVDTVGSAEAASNALNDMGIKGMVSSDQSTYVLFDKEGISGILDKPKPPRAKNTISADRAIGEVTPKVHRQHVQSNKQVESIQKAVDALGRYGITYTEIQTLTKIMDVLRGAMRPFITKRDSSKSFASMVDKLVADLQDASSLSNDVYSEIKALTDADPFAEASRALVKDSVLSLVTGIKSFTPLQQRIADVLMAAAASDYQLAADRAKWLSEDLQNHDMAGVMMQVNTNAGTTPVADAILFNREIERTPGATDVEQLRLDIPNSERVLDKPNPNGSPVLMNNGERFIDQDLEQAGPGLESLGITDEIFKEIWSGAKKKSRDPVQKALDKIGIKGPVRPKDFAFWDRALKLADQARYWYEISTESMREILPTLSQEEMVMFFELVAATSPNTNPIDNMKRAVSVLGYILDNRPAVTATMAQPGSKYNAVAKAILSMDTQTNKIHNFGGTFLYLAGYTPQVPLSTNDRQVASSFNMKHEKLFSNQPVYFTLSRFYLDLAKALNKRLPEGAEPYQAWQLQALGWVQERIESDSGSNQNDDYMEALNLIRDMAIEAGLMEEGDLLTHEVLTDPRLQQLIDPTTMAWLEAKKTTVEMWSERSPATQEVEKLKPLIWRRVGLTNKLNGIIRRSARKLVSRYSVPDPKPGKPDNTKKMPSIPSVIMSALAGKPVDITRIDYGEGTFDGNSNLNVRIPLKTNDQLHIKQFLAVLADGLDQWIAPATYNRILGRDEQPTGLPSAQVFIRNKLNIDVEFLSKKLPGNFNMSVSYASNGTIIDFVPDFDTKGGPYTITVEQAQNFITNVLPDADFDAYPTSFESVASFVEQEASRQERTVSLKQAKADAMSQLRELLPDLKVRPLERFLQGSDALLIDNKKDVKLIDKLYNIRNDYAINTSFSETAAEQITGTLDGFLAHAIDLALKEVPNAKLPELRQYFQTEAGTKAQWPSKVQGRLNTIRTEYKGRVDNFTGALEATRKVLAEQQNELTDLAAEVKDTFPDSQIEPLMDASAEIVMEVNDRDTPTSVSFEQDAPTKDTIFQIEQLEMQLSIEQMNREDRTDIGAGRREKELRQQINQLEAVLEAAEEAQAAPAQNIDDRAERLVHRTDEQKSLKTRLGEYKKERLRWDYWKDQFTSWYQYWVSDIAAIERLEKQWVKDLRKKGEIDTKGKYREGNQSPVALTFQAKNAEVAAATAIHRTGVRLVNGQLVPDERQKGLEPILEPIARLGKTKEESNMWLRRWEAYILVKRAERLRAEGKEQFVMDEDIQAIQEYVYSRPVLKELFDRTQEEYAALNRQVLEVAIDAGYINREDAFGGYWGEVTDENGNVLFTLKGEKNTVFPDQDVVATQLEQWMIDNDKPNANVNVYERSGWYHDDYVPFNRVNEAQDGQTQERNQGGRIGEVRKGVIGLTGGIGSISVIENMSKNITFMISGALKTVAMREVITMTEGVAADKIELNGEAPMIDAKNAKAIAEEMGVDIETMDTADAQRWLRMLTRATPFDRDAVVFYENGRAKYYRVTDPLLLQAMKQVGVRETVSWLHKLGFITRILTKSITIMPGFLVRNFARESQNTFIIDEKNSANPLMHMGRAMKHVWQLARDPNKSLEKLQAAQDLYKKQPTQENRAKVAAAQAEYDRKTSAIHAMMAAGNVSYNNYYDVTPPEIRKRLMKISKSKSTSWMRKIINSPVTFGRFYMRLAIASEHANRLTVRENYINNRTKELKKKYGRDLTADEMSTVVAEAGSRAMDVLNFSRRGAGLGADIAIAVLPFINPRIQGLDRLVRGAKYNKTNVGMKLGMMTMAAMAMAMYNWDENEEEMEDLKEVDKDLFYHFWFKNPSTGEKEHYRIPKGFEIGQVAGTLPERIVERIMADRPEPAEKVAKRFLQTTFGLQPPQPVKPLMEVAMNYDTFRQRPILNFGMQFKPAHMQYDAYTNYVVKDVAQSMPDWMPDSVRSPKYLQHLLQGYFGPVGAMVLESGNQLYRETGNAPDAPRKEVSQYYGIRDYYRSNVEYSARSLDYFYEMLTTANKTASELKTMKEEGDPRYKEFKDKNRQITRARSRLNKISKRVGNINKQMKAIYADPEMSPEMKQEKLQRLQKRRNIITRETMAQYWEVFY